MKTAAQRDIEWEKLSRLRWAGANESPGFVVDPDWRTLVARLPHTEWCRWSNRVEELSRATMPPRPSVMTFEESAERADRVHAIERQAWEEISGD